MSNSLDEPPILVRDLKLLKICFELIWHLLEKIRVKLVLLDLTMVLLYNLKVELLVKKLTVHFLAETGVNGWILSVGKLALKHLESDCSI